MWVISSELIQPITKKLRKEANALLQVASKKNNPINKIIL